MNGIELAETPGHAWTWNAKATSICVITSVR